MWIYKSAEWASTTSTRAVCIVEFSPPPPLVVAVIKSSSLKMVVGNELGEELTIIGDSVIVVGEIVVDDWIGCIVIMFAGEERWWLLVCRWWWFAVDVIGDDCGCIMIWGRVLSMSGSWDAFWRKIVSLVVLWLWLLPFEECCVDGTVIVWICWIPEDVVVVVVGWWRLGLVDFKTFTTKILGFN